jgi:hypothetical protein
MTFQQRDLSGSLFKNTNKTADTRADYNGTGNIIWTLGCETALKADT